MNSLENYSCPIPISDYEKVTLAHGGGGTLSQKLIQKMFLPQFDNPLLNLQHDGAIFEVNGNKLAFSTDSYVVKPIFFPGGNIGELAVNGTVNDLAMCGANPLYISAGFIIEEGFSMEELWQIILSMKKAAEKAGVQIVTGDTKVVDKGKGDKIFINTSGVGVINENRNISPLNCKAGDKIILSGKIAQHGIAIMSAREGLEFDSEVKSDTAALNKLVDEMFNSSQNIHVLRDPTRGGISSALNEIAQSSNFGMMIYEKDIPIDEQVRAACEILGLDPLYIANEGKLIAIVDPADADKVLAVMKNNKLGLDASIIGEVNEQNYGKVIMKTTIGSKRVVDMLSGEQLPRIC
ncbi:MAG: hydrogenase expression/formation protein HypE [Ignavibacteriaceae bacterium]